MISNQNICINIRFKRFSVPDKKFLDFFLRQFGAIENLITITSRWFKTCFFFVLFFCTYHPFLHDRCSRRNKKYVIRFSRWNNRISLIAQNNNNKKKRVTTHIRWKLIFPYVHVKRKIYEVISKHPCPLICVTLKNGDYNNCIEPVRKKKIKTQNLHFTCIIVTTILCVFISVPIISCLTLS